DICQPSTDRLHPTVGGRAVGERAQSALVMADGIIVRVHRARSVSGSHEVARAFGLIGGKAPVMAQRFEIAQPRRLRAGDAFEGAARPLMQLASAGKEEVLVDC